MEECERQWHINSLFLWQYVNAEPGFSACNLLSVKM